MSLVRERRAECCSRSKHRERCDAELGARAHTLVLGCTGDKAAEATLTLMRPACRLLNGLHRFLPYFLLEVPNPTEHDAAAFR